MVIDTAGIPFSWSLRRQRMWDQCRRRYVLHYYAPRGGHDIDAAPRLRELHEMRSLLTAAEYRKRLLMAELRGYFYAAHEDGEPEFPAEAPRLATTALRIFRRDFPRMLTGQWRADHKIPMLTELYYNTARPAEVHENMMEALREAVRKLESGVWEMLFKTRFLHRRPIASPLPVTVHRLTCFTAPLLAFQEQGRLHIVDRSDADATALLHKFHAMNELRIPPERTHSLYLDLDQGVLRELGSELNISRTLAEIMAGAGEMRGAIRPDGRLYLEDFPVSDAAEVCAACSFRRYCHR